jgi:L-cysteine S-thiosulfotransferase
MRIRLPLATILAGAVLLGLASTSLAPARGDAASDALKGAIKRGEELWRRPAGSGGKSCAECHGGGANAMKSTRLKAYPRYDKGMAKVVTGQQKINQMISDKSKSALLDLGSDDMNALEAYMASLPAK